VAFKQARSIKHILRSVAGILAEPAANRRAIPATVNYTPPADISTLSTGLRPLDKAVGIGGLPYGKITELLGPNSTTLSGGAMCLAAAIAAKTQRQQEIVTIVDLTHQVDPWQLERCGLAAPHLLLVRPDTFFAALTSLEQAAHKAKLVILVMGVVGELLSQFEPDLRQTLFRRLQKIVKGSDSAFLIITHPAESDPFSPTNYPPGFPLPEIADIRLWIQSENWTQKIGLTTAYKATITVVKNQLAIPGKGANIRIKLVSS